MRIFDDEIDGNAADVAWIGNKLAVQIVPFNPASGFESRIWLIDPESGDAEVLALPNRSDCERQGFEAPTRLSNGNLGYVVRCLLPNERVEQLFMMSYDFRRKVTASLLSYPLPSSQIGTGGFSWNPKMTRGITSDGVGRGLSEQLYWITPERSEKLLLGFPQAFSASWSPNGERIAFVAANEQGLSGQGRINAVFNLYLMQTDTTNLRALVSGFRNPYSISWSPNNKWIVFPAMFGNVLKEEGLWLVNVDTGERRKLINGSFSASAWSPKGDQLAVIRYSGSYPNLRQQVVIYNVILPSS
jgi:Tol biopolymer transport system component